MYLTIRCCAPLEMIRSQGIHQLMSLCLGFGKRELIIDRIRCAIYFIELVKPPTRTVVSLVSPLLIKVVVGGLYGEIGATRIIACPKLCRL